MKTWKMKFQSGLAGCVVGYETEEISSITTVIVLSRMQQILIALAPAYWRRLSASLPVRASHSSKTSDSWIMDIAAMPKHALYASRPAT